MAVDYYQARDVELIFKYASSKLSTVRMRGLITAIRNHGKIFFISLRDITGAIQLVFNYEQFDQESWSDIKSLETRDRIEVEGVVGMTSRQTLSIFVKSLKKLMTSEDADKVIKLDDSISGTLTSQFLLAKLRSKSVEYMIKNGYIEFTSYYLTSSRLSPHLEPLQVNFPGWGGYAHLSVSPVSQMIRALTAANTKVFCVSRWLYKR